MKHLANLLAHVFALLACVSTTAFAGPREDAANALLDRFHAAAARVEFDNYFARFTPDCVFLGTDATERWTVAQVKAYAKPVMSG